jgi:hypothetical protein
MSVRIELDNTHQGVYTCLDYVSGNVILNLPSDDTSMFGCKVVLENEAADLS